MDQLFSNYWTNFEALLGCILGLESAQQGDQKKDKFWNPLALHLRGPGVAKTENKQEGGKGKLLEICPEKEREG